MGDRQEQSVVGSDSHGPEVLAGDNHGEGRRHGAEDAGELSQRSSAEKSYQYNHSGTVMLEVNGEKSSFLVGKKGDAYEYAIIPKATHGWKLGLGVDMEQVIQTTSDGISIQVYRHKKTG